MKKLLFILLILPLVVSCVGFGTVKEEPESPVYTVESNRQLEDLLEQSEGNKVRAFTAHTGGGTGALDKVSVSNLTDGDISLVVLASTQKLYFYVFDDDGTDAEDTTDFKYIRPDDYSSAGVHDLVTMATIGLDLAASADPNFEFRDSESPGTDKSSAWIKAVYVDGADGSENADFFIEIIQGGAENTEVLRFDESDDRWETTKGWQVGGSSSLAGADMTTGLTDMGDGTAKMPTTTTGDQALTIGMFGLKGDEDMLVFHGGASGEVQTEAGISLLEHIVLIVDLSWYYDQETTYRALPIMKVGDDFPHGFTIVELSLRAVGGDPTTELTNVDLYCDTTPDYDLAANATKMDDLDSTAGVFTEDATFVSATCANGSFMYIDIGDDPTDDNVVWIFEMWGYAEED